MNLCQLSKSTFDCFMEKLLLNQNVFRNHLFKVLKAICTDFYYSCKGIQKYANMRN